MYTFPLAQTGSEEEIAKIRHMISERGLVGAANNTKWNQLLSFMRQKKDWVPSFRYQTVNGYVSEWDVEWWAHLPFPFVGVVWFDLGTIQILSCGTLLRDEQIDHTPRIVNLLDQIGFEYEQQQDVIRIFAYLPKCYHNFPSST